MRVLETERLVLRHLGDGDDAFILELLNEPSFIQNIADRGVRTVDDARRYIQERLVASYELHGYGLCLVVLKEGGTPAGICGLVRREGLDDPDIGFAFLPRFWSQGYATESVAAVLEYARSTLGLPRLLAIVSPGNASSIRVLERMGLSFEGMVLLPGQSSECKLFALALGPGMPSRSAMTPAEGQPSG